MNWKSEYKNIQVMLNSGMKRSAIAAHYGVNKNQLAGAIYAMSGANKERLRRQHRTHYKTREYESGWNETLLTERWEDRKARRAKERASAKAGAALQDQPATTLPLDKKAAERASLWRKRA